MSWTRAVHIQDWAKSIEARGQLPQLLRRLITSTIPNIHEIDFPAHEQIHRPGFDGVLRVSKGHQFVPEGDSVWEFGVNNRPATKADRDFDKRTAKTSPADQATRTYVVVTPHEWLRKGDWAAEQMTRSKWKNVIVLDCNDIEQWLEMSTDTDIWFATLIGRRPPGVTTLDAEWDALKSIAQFPLLPTVFLAGREEAEKALLGWVTSTPSSLFVQSRDVNTGRDFLSSMYAKHAASCPRLAQTIVVSSYEAWRQLACRKDARILVPTSDLALSATDVSEAIHNGHHVMVCNCATSTLSPEHHIELPDLGHYELGNALISSGYAEARARSLSRACCGSSTVLKRLITNKPSTLFPEWSQIDHAVRLAPYALIGAWLDVRPLSHGKSVLPDTTPYDLLFLRDLLDVNEDDINTQVMRWSSGSDALFRRFGNYITVASREDAWHLLGGYISRSLLSKFEAVAIEVLSEVDPALALDPDKRWTANIFGHVLSLSPEMRRGILESMVLMVAYPTAKAPPPDVDFKAACQHILERVLPIGATWQLWASLRENLELLAECNPEFLISRIEADLASADPELPKLFQDKDASHFATAEHTHLLWALETISWKPSLLPRVIVSLGKLAKRDPGGMYANRPRESILSILALNRSAGPIDRIQSLQRLIAAEPEIGWKIVADLLPGGSHRLGQMPHQPRYRDWSNQRADNTNFGAQLFDAIADAAGNSLNAWSEIMEGMLRMNADSTCSHLQRLTSNASGDEESRYKLWEALRALTFKHRSFAGESWTFSDATLCQLETVRDCFQPADVILRNLWLFNHHVDIPSIARADFEGKHRFIEERQSEAIRDILQANGFEGIKQLMEMSGWHAQIGYAIGRSRLLEWHDVEAPDIFECDNNLFVFAANYALARYHSEGSACIGLLNASKWTNKALTFLASSLPPCREVWDWIDELPEAVRIEYWKKRRFAFHRLPDDDREYAIRRLEIAGRPFAALDVLTQGGCHLASISGDRLVRLLINGLQTDEAVDRHQQYVLQCCIGHVQGQSDVPREKLFQIEWGYLELLDRHSSPTRPITLEATLFSDPSSFATILTLIYPNERLDRTSTWYGSDKQIVSQRAETLLQSLTMFPGMEPDGSTDYRVAHDWASSVRGLSDPMRLYKVDFEIGKLCGAHLQGQVQLPSECLSIVEGIGTEHAIDGFCSGMIYGRGMTTSWSRDGGERERELSARYGAAASRYASALPKVSEALHRLSQKYASDARSEELSYERERVGR